MAPFLERNDLNEFLSSVVSLMLLCFWERAHSVAQTGLEPTLNPRLTSDSP